jgi:GT2 family glycosyltransferase
MAVDSSRLKVSVVIVSWRRPIFVHSCLEHLGRLELRADEVLVVDASPDELTAAVVEKFAWARYLRFPKGAGHMTTSRNFSLCHVTGDIIAFLDDDANARPGWLGGLLEAFADPTVGAVAGRTCNGHPGEERQGREAIGRILMNGQLTANFAANPGSLIEVEHGIGANMSFRRQVLARLGGFRDDFRGVGGVREDADIFLRTRALGYRALFSPSAVVDHVGAPHAQGRRFDLRYTFWMRHNHALLLARNYGLGSHSFRRWVYGELLRTLRIEHPSWMRRGARIGIRFAGLLAGIAASVQKGRWHASDPVRRDRTGREIRRSLRGENC